MEACTDVFVASTDQSHWRHEIVNWDSTDRAIASPRREVLAVSLFCPA